MSSGIEQFFVEKILTESSAIAALALFFWWQERRERISMTKKMVESLDRVTSAFNILNERLK